MNPDLRDNTEILYQMLESNNPGGVESCLALGVNFDQPCTNSDFIDCLPLHMAAISPHSPDKARIIHMLLDAGCDIDGPCRASNSTPLMVASDSGEWLNFRLLLDMGANPHLKDTTGNAVTSITQYNRDKMELETTPNTHYESYCKQLKGYLHNLPADPDRYRRMLFDDDGKATGRATAIIHANLMPHVFTPKRWVNKEADAVDLYDQLVAVLPPPLRAIVRKEIEVSDLRSKAVEKPSSPSAVERYKAKNRKSKGHDRE